MASRPLCRRLPCNHTALNRHAKVTSHLHFEKKVTHFPLPTLPWTKAASHGGAAPAPRSSRPTPPHSPHLLLKGVIFRSQDLGVCCAHCYRRVSMWAASGNRFLLKSRVRTDAFGSVLFLSGSSTFSHSVFTSFSLSEDLALSSNMETSVLYSALIITHRVAPDRCPHTTPESVPARPSSESLRGSFGL